MPPAARVGDMHMCMYRKNKISEILIIADYNGSGGDDGWHGQTCLSMPPIRRTLWIIAC